MNKNYFQFNYSSIIIAFVFILFTLSCKNDLKENRIVYTRTLKENGALNNINIENRKYQKKSQIVFVNIHKPQKSVKVLTGDFYSACSPDISYDGNFMLFAAKKNENDTWQIWEMNLKNMEFRKITSFKEDCIDPVYLPINRLIFTKLAKNDSTGKIQHLYSGGLYSSVFKQITFYPHANFSSTVLNDGRILAISQQVFPVSGNQIFMVMRPDGTKADMFYEPMDSSILVSRARDKKNGMIYFIEAKTDEKTEGSLIAINQNRPLFTRDNLTSEIKGSFCSVFPLQSEKLLVTYRPDETDNYSVYKFDPKESSLSTSLFEDFGFDIIDVVVAEKYNRPRNLPSEVDEGVKTGQVMCQNINILSSYSPNVSSQLKAVSIEVLGIDTTYGVVKVEEDGSFYLKVIADVPFRIQTLDENGKVVHGPCAWIYLRPNERRGCVGCHENRELVPENIVPMAVKKSPVIIPVHITEIIEKTVELE